MSSVPTILVVDDDPDIRGIMQEALQSVGYHVLEADTCAEGLRQACERRPQIVLLDVVLPDGNGIEVCHRIKSDPELAGTFVILISGHALGRQDRITGLEIGADEYVAKPIFMDELLARVRAMLRIHDALEALRESKESIRHLNEMLERRVSDRTAELRAANEQLASDVQERKRAAVTLRRLSRRILETQEHERRRVARDLHDSVNQILASVRFRIQAMEARLATLAPRLLPDARRAQELLEHALGEVRRISHNLRPSELDDLGLVSAVRQACEEFASRTGVAIDFRARGRRRFSGDIELALYRIVQEALNNVEKHARAKRVRLSLLHSPAQIELEVADDGRGFRSRRPARGRSHAGLGLLHMRERAAAIGGDFAVASDARHGTRVTVKVPLRKGKEE